MRAFTLDHAGAGTKPDAVFIAGGTDLLQLMKDEVTRPDHLVDLDGALPDTVRLDGDVLHLGALARMSDVAAHPDVQQAAPAVSQALLLAASPQIRNMGTMGGNLLQRTRCLYFRDPGFACNKRAPGSGCPAIAGENRMLSVLGGSAHCIATHPSDLPVALMAFDATVHLRGADGGTRDVAIADFYRLPGDTPHIETVLAPGEMITGISVPVSAATRRSAYVKIRDRASFEFALVSAAVGIDVQDGVVRDVRVALGGVAPRPWRLPRVEAALRGQPATEAQFTQAAALASQDAHPASRNGFKLRLMQQAVHDALNAVTAQA